jgi:hypothetical protein
MAGLARVVGGLASDPTQFDPASPYHDPKSSPAQPRWLKIDVQLVRKTRLLTLAEMRAAPELATMQVLQRGNRLSITPVTPAEWQAVLARLEPDLALLDPTLVAELLALGLVVGFLAGLLGVGGGMMMVPVLTCCSRSAACPPAWR